MRRLATTSVVTRAASKPTTMIEIAAGASTKKASSIVPIRSGSPNQSHPRSRLKTANAANVIATPIRNRSAWFQPVTSSSKTVNVSRNSTTIRNGQARVQTSPVAVKFGAAWGSPRRMNHVSMAASSTAAQRSARRDRSAVDDLGEHLPGHDLDAESGVVHLAIDCPAERRGRG